MENVLAAVIIIFILLFGTLTLSSAFLSAQEIVYDAWEDANGRSEVLSNTNISLQDIEILSSGSVIEVTLRNTGTVKLADFDDWDVFADYFDGSATPEYYSVRLPYDGETTSKWLNAGIFINAEDEITEGFEPNILNPAEELVLQVLVSPAVGAGQMAQVTVSTPNGVRTSLAGVRNIPPVLATLDPTLKIASSSTATIMTDALETTDEDNDAAELVYTIDVPPEQGTLSPETFTQAQIDGGEVTYTHSGTGEDSFSFLVSDGIDEIGPVTFTITINTPPTIAVNAGVTGNQDETTDITALMLQAADTDEDDPPADLVYIVTQSPVNGTLSLGSQFTQAQIDAGELTYTHANPGTTADLFTFVVTDGYDVTGANTFYITLNEAPGP
jgi:archaellum component FlaF (FlaF/FlaG flagellin family)